MAYAPIVRAVFIPTCSRTANDIIVDKWRGAINVGQASVPVIYYWLDFFEKRMLMLESGFEDYKRRHLAFWYREEAASPLIGFAVGAGLDSWSYWQDNKAAQALLQKKEIRPSEIDPAAFVDGQLGYLERSMQVGDDVWRTAMPLASIPWMEAILGCPILSSGTHLASRPVADSPASLHLPWFEPDNPWIQKYLEFLQVYGQTLGGRYPVAQSVLRGPSDLACALLGAENATVALLDQPDSMRWLLGQITQREEEFLRLQMEHLRPFQGGYVIGQYDIWAPEKPLRLQEDFSNLYSPKLYSEFLQPLDRRLAALTSYNLIHLHASSLFLIDHFLEIEELRLFQVTKDEGTPSLSTMMPSLIRIQAAGRPLIVKGRFTTADLQLLREKLSPCGLCLQPVVGSLEEAWEMLPGLRKW